jgi:cytochrome c5
MKSTKQHLLLAFSLALAIAATSCSKESASTPDSMYVPSSSDATSTATLADLQQGRSLYISNCADCHSLYLPESFTASQWRNIMPSMSPRTSLTSAQVQMVLKYVTKGK